MALYWDYPNGRVKRNFGLFETRERFRKCMREQAVDRRWFEEQLRKKGFTSQKEFAAAIGLDGPKLTNLLTGKRRPQLQDLLAMSSVLDTAMTNLVRCFGARHIKATPTGILIQAAVFDDDSLEFHDLLDGNSADQIVDSPCPDYRGTGIQIRTSALSPRYFEGEVLLARIRPDQDRAEVEHLLGREAFVALAESGIFLKLVQPGSRPGLYTLASLNVRTAPLVDVEVEWAEPIDFHIPGWFRPKNR
jgi:transcriptional regulator with XRE-family HTH domain